MSTPSPPCSLWWTPPQTVPRRRLYPTLQKCGQLWFWPHPASETSGYIQEAATHLSLWTDPIFIQKSHPTKVMKTSVCSSWMRVRKIESGLFHQFLLWNASNSGYTLSIPTVRFLKVSHTSARVLKCCRPAVVQQRKIVLTWHLRDFFLLFLLMGKEQHSNIQTFRRTSRLLDWIRLGADAVKKCFHWHNLRNKANKRNHPKWQILSASQSGERQRHSTSGKPGKVVTGPLLD